MTDWVVQSPSSSAWSGQASYVLADGQWLDAAPWDDSQDWVDAPTWMPVSGNNTPWAPA